MVSQVSQVKALFSIVLFLDASWHLIKLDRFITYFISLSLDML